MISFKKLKQHALNSDLTITCTECDKLQLVYTQEKPHNNILRKFKQISRLLFTYSINVPEVTGNNKDLSQLHIRGSLTCLILVEKLYYSSR